MPNKHYLSYFKCTVNHFRTIVEYPLVFANVVNMKLEIYSDTATTLIPSNDRAFNYGDGFFTTMCCLDQQIHLFDLHIQRLQSDAKRLFVEISDWSGLIKAIQNTAMSAPRQCVIKVHISLGQGGRGYSRGAQSEPRALIKVSPFPDSLDALSLSVGQGYLSEQSMLAGIKHCNRLEQVLFKRQADVLGIDDVVCLDSRQHIIETSSANLFWFANNTWHTPSLNHCGVNGVYRQFLLNMFTYYDMDFLVGDYGLIDLINAESAFACNAVRGVMPIKQINVSHNNQQTLSLNQQRTLQEQTTLYTNTQLPALQTLIQQFMLIESNK